jgi:hypothetical protein
VCVVAFYRAPEDVMANAIMSERRNRAARSAIN